MYGKGNLFLLRPILPQSNETIANLTERLEVKFTLVCHKTVSYMAQKVGRRSLEHTNDGKKCVTPVP